MKAIQKRLQALEEQHAAGPGECQCKESFAVRYKNPVWTGQPAIDGPALCATCGKPVRTLITVEYVNNWRGAA